MELVLVHNVVADALTACAKGKRNRVKTRTHTISGMEYPADFPKVNLEQLVRTVG